jgi:hypothetical protein
MIDFVKALADCNALAVVVAAAAAFALGALWYSPVLFVSPWMKELGFTKKDTDKAMKDGKLPRQMALGFTATVLLSLAVAMLLNLIGASGLWNGVWIGLFAGLGFSATTVYIHYVYESRRLRLFAITAGYNVAMCVLIGGILGVWPR